jgi:hypothetical protein
VDASNLNARCPQPAMNVREIPEVEKVPFPGLQMEGF